MFRWPKKKMNLQKLQKQYSRLMKNSYLLAVKDKEKSDRLHEKACKIMIEIKKLQHVS